MGYDPSSFAGLADARRSTAESPGEEVSEREFERAQDKVLARRHLRRRESDVILRARVDHGRWLADCPTCEMLDAALVVPGFARGCCLGCGTSYLIAFPSAEEIEVATRVLSLRPVELRNWNPAEQSVGLLAEENARHGLPS